MFTSFSLFSRLSSYPHISCLSNLSFVEYFESTDFDGLYPAIKMNTPTKTWLLFNTIVRFYFFMISIILFSFWLLSSCCCWNKYNLKFICQKFPYECSSYIYLCVLFCCPYLIWDLNLASLCTTIKYIYTYTLKFTWFTILVIFSYLFRLYIKIFCFVLICRQFLAYNVKVYGVVSLSYYLWFVGKVFLLKFLCEDVKRKHYIIRRLSNKNPRKLRFI